MVHELKTGLSLHQKRMGNELKNKILEYNGIISEDIHKKRPSIANCPRCELVNALENKYCSKCSYPLVPEAFDQIKQNEENRFMELEKNLREEMEKKFQQLITKINVGKLQ